MNTSKITEFYLSFTDISPFPFYFQLLSDKASFDLCVEAARCFDLRATQIHLDSARPTDPIISVVAITDIAISRDDAEHISQAAIDWLQANNYWKFPTKP